MRGCFWRQEWAVVRRNATKIEPQRLPAVVEPPCGIAARLEMFSDEYDADDYKGWVKCSNDDPVPTPLMLYLQNADESSRATDVPPCSRHDEARAIEKEVGIQGALFAIDRPLELVVLAGSIATTWSDEQLLGLISAVHASFRFNNGYWRNGCSYIGSALPGSERLRLLHTLGFNQIVLEPDYTLPVSALIETLVVTTQQVQQTGFNRTTIDMRRAPTGSGLPVMLGGLIDRARPNHLRVPHTKGQQSDVMDKALQAAGFLHFGLDWYVRDDDPWWLARQAGRIRWTLLGYRESAGADVLGIGPGALSAVADCYSLNSASPRAYIAKIEPGGLPIERGIELEPADQLRHEIIAMILVDSCIRVAWLEERWGIQFNQFFAQENDRLKTLEGDHRVIRKPDCIDIVEQNFEQIIEICKVFKDIPRSGRAAAMS